MPCAAERAELLSLLTRHGILRTTADQPLQFLDGSPAIWMLDSLRVTLSARGAELAARCLLELLSRFESRQIATYGVTGIPLLQACVMQSQGAFRGLVVRKEPKRASGRRIEGDIDPRQPVILLDDSIASGQAMFAGVEELEKAGLRVEGGVCLVRFGWGSGFARLCERGFHMEYVFDALADLSPIVDGPAAVLPRNPSKREFPIRWADDHAPEGLHPAKLARLILQQALSAQLISRPPQTLDHEYDGSGGTWVSVRPHSNILLRHARDGFWHLPGELRAPLPEEVILSSLRTANRMKDSPTAIGDLETSGVAVTFFGALEECTPGQIDNDRYGILVCSRERPGHWGGALPRMPGMYREWAQLEHARKNAQLLAIEPYVIYRHTVAKAVEPGIDWQPTGMPLSDAEQKWDNDPQRVGQTAMRAIDLARHIVSGEAEHTAPLPDDLLPELNSLLVTIYVAGKVMGCMGAKVSQLDTDLRRAVQQALGDPRFGIQVTVDNLAELAVSISLLHQPMNLGVQTPAEIAVRVRLGEQVLFVFQGARQGLLLPFAALQHSLNREQYVAEVIDKAGITRPPYNWGTYECTTWLVDNEAPRRLVQGLPTGTPPATLTQAIEILTPRLCEYLLRHQREDGLRVGYYRPLLDHASDTLDLPRQVHGTWILARAQRILGDARLAIAARLGIDTLIKRVERDASGDTWLQTEQPSIAEISCLLLALCELERPQTDELARNLAQTLVHRIDQHGHIATMPIADAKDLQQDYLPAQALLALGVAAAHDKANIEREVIERAFAYYRHRFRYARHFGPVAWLPQAAAAWWQVWRDDQTIALAFEVIDWALTFQQEKSGGFINDQQPDSPGYTTGVYLEGVAAALRLAMAVKDVARTDRYRDACERGWRFLDGLIYQERDRSLLPNPQRAYGGLRLSPTASDVRIDFVQHALNALLELRLAQAVRTSAT